MWLRDLLTCNKAALLVSLKLLLLLLQADLLPTCRELGIGVLAYSPLGRGLLTGVCRTGAGAMRLGFHRVEMPSWKALVSACLHHPSLRPAGPLTTPLSSAVVL